MPSRYAVRRSVKRTRNRLLSEAETAELLRMSPSTFSRRSRELEVTLGMPPRHPVLKRRYAVALHNWLNTVYGAGEKPDTVADLVRQRMGTLRGGHGAH